MTTPTTTPVQHITLDDTLKLMRAELAREFPGVKFSIRRSRGTGYGYVSVSWTDGPRYEDVNEITSGYEGSSFDGMQDLESPISHTAADANGNAVRVHYGTRGISCQRSLSPAVQATQYRRAVRAFLGETEGAEYLRMTDDALNAVAHAVRVSGEYLTTLAHRIENSTWAPELRNVSGERIA